MSASCDLCIIMSGKNRNKYLDNIIEALSQIEGISSEEGKKMFRVVDGKNLWTNVKETSILLSNDKVKNIWGDNYLNFTADLCINIAQAVPAAEWMLDASSISESGGDGCESYMKATYKAQTLEVKIDNYVDTVTLPMLINRTMSDDQSYDAFCEYYNVDETIDEDTYEEYRYDDEDDDFYYKPESNSVSKEHFWQVSTHTIS